MKNYKKQQYTGNENGWAEPIKTLGVTAIDETHANELNSQFRNTGIKYEETDETPSGFNGSVTTNEADHGEPKMVVKDGEFVETDNKAKEKAAELQNENGKVEEGNNAETTQQTADPKDDDAFVKSDGEVKSAEVEKLKEGVDGAANNPA